MDDPIEVAAGECGGVSKLAALMGESPQTISNWRTRGVPLQRCAELEALSGGKVKRWHLRPQDWHRIWPELVDTAGAPPTAEPAKVA